MKVWLRKYQQRILMLNALSVMGYGLTVYLLVEWAGARDLALLSSLLVSIAGSFYIYFLLRKIDRAYFTHLVNITLPDLQFSSHLWWKDDLNEVEKLQLRRLEKRWKEYQLPWRNWKRLVFSFSLAACSSVLFLSFNEEESGIPNLLDAVESLNKADSVERTTAQLTEYNLRVRPPAYTGIQEFYAGETEVEVPQGSLVEVGFTFDAQPEWYGWEFNGRSAFENRTSPVRWRPEDNQVIQLLWESESQKHYGPLTTVWVKEDTPPTIQILGMEPYQLVDSMFRKVSFSAEVGDDYGVKEARVVATVSKGEGESVKFRELEIKPSSQRMVDNVVSFSFQWDLKELGMEPGDELYFYVEARDNRPESQITRTQSYFIEIEGEEYETMTMEAGFGLDIMPDYFRSQRQLIMDTKKLIAARNTMAREAFNDSSNVLARDQKALRLKYGQFLGEENESQIAAESAEVGDEDQGEEDVLDEFGHNHDTEEAHDREVLGEANTEDPLEDYLHDHDNEETMTFHFAATKVKLRAALSMMWESELQLRLYQPEKSLPTQYKILDLLEEVKQHARIYVERIGFEPPPIKENEKRLSGDLKDVDLRKRSRETPKVSLPDFSTLAQAVREKKYAELDRQVVENTMQYFISLEGELEDLEVIGILNQWSRQNQFPSSTEASILLERLQEEYEARGEYQGSFEVKSSLGLEAEYRRIMTEKNSNR